MTTVQDLPADIRDAVAHLDPEHAAEMADLADHWYASADAARDAGDYDQAAATDDLADALVSALAAAGYAADGTRTRTA